MIRRAIARFVRWGLGDHYQLCGGCGAIVRADLHPSSRCLGYQFEHCEDSGWIAEREDDE